MTVVNTKFIQIRSSWCSRKRTPVVTFKAMGLLSMTNYIHSNEQYVSAVQ